MVIYELGIVRSGVTLISRQHPRARKINKSSVLHGGFLSSLNAFVEEVFSDEIESLTMKNFQIFILKCPQDESNGGNLISYIIGDKNLGAKKAREIITRVLGEFLLQNKHLKKFKGNINDFSDFFPIFDKVLMEAN